MQNNANGIYNDLADEEFIKAFFITGVYDRQENFFISENIRSEIDINYCEKLLNIEVCAICKYISKYSNTVVVLPSNIPQYSDFIDGTINICNILEDAGNTGFRYNEIGEYLTHKGKQKIAYLKYGENHAKLAELLGLVKIQNNNKYKLIYLTQLGCQFNSYNEKMKIEILRRLSLKVPVVQKILSDAQQTSVKVNDYLVCLAKSTQDRRLGNVFKIIELVHKGDNQNNLCYKNIEKR